MNALGTVSGSRLKESRVGESLNLTHSETGYRGDLLGRPGKLMDAGWGIGGGMDCAERCDGRYLTQGNSLIMGDSLGFW